MKTMKTALFTTLTLGMVAASSQAATVSLADVNAQRVLDTNLDGSGDAVQNSVLDVGVYNLTPNDNNVHAVFVFQMTGIGAPANIVSADFSVTQYAGVGVAVGSLFDVQAHVIRTAATPTIVTTDYQDSAQLLMSNFDNSNTAGNVSLDAAAETTLGTWLSNNWSDGDYVFIGLKSNPRTLNITTTHRVWRYGDSTGGWAVGSTDALLTLETVPEPSTTALLGLGGLALILRRRK